jgi:hypothetical protein
MAGNIHPLDELAALLAKAKETPPGRRPYQDVLSTVKNTEKSLTYTVEFPHKSPSDELKEKAMEEAGGAAQAAAAPAAAPAPAVPPETEPTAAPKAEASMDKTLVYRTSNAEVRLPAKLADMPSPELQQAIKTITQAAQQGDEQLAAAMKTINVDQIAYSHPPLANALKSGDVNQVRQALGIPRGKAPAAAPAAPVPAAAPMAGAAPAAAPTAMPRAASADKMFVYKAANVEVMFPEKMTKNADQSTVAYVNGYIQEIQHAVQGLQGLMQRPDTDPKKLEAVKNHVIRCVRPAKSVYRILEQAEKKIGRAAGIDMSGFGPFVSNTSIGYLNSITDSAISTPEGLQEVANNIVRAELKAVPDDLAKALWHADSMGQGQAAASSSKEFVYKSAGIEVVLPESLTVEAKKNTKTVPEEKFKSCKEQVKKNSPDVNEYAVCTDSLGGQPASYHKKKKKASTDGKVAVASAGKEAVTALRKAYPDEFLKQMGIA